MKLLILTLISAVCLNASAAAADTVPCKREMLASALSTWINATTLQALISSSFEVTDFQPSSNNGFGDFDYVVTCQTKNRIDNSSTTILYGVKVTDASTCTVKTKMFAD